MDEMKWHPAAKIFPMLELEQLRELADDIKANGQREPCAIFEGMILDGRNRSAACKLVGLEPKIVQVNPRDPVAYVLSMNLHRRHLKPNEAAMAAARAKEVYAERAKERQRLSEGRGKKGLANCPDLKTGNARDEAGKAFGVSGRQVERASRVQNKGIPELVDAVDAGEISVSAGSQIAGLDECEQAAAVQAAKRKEQKAASPKPSTEPSATNHMMTEQFAMNNAGVAVNQLSTIPADNPHRDKGFRRVFSFMLQAGFQP